MRNFYPLSGSFARLSLLLLILASPCLGSDGDPVAVRFWKGDVVTLETDWNLIVRLDGADNAEVQPQDTDLRVSLGNSNATLTGKQLESQTIPLTDLDHYLDRPANQSEVQLTAVSDATFVSENAVRVSSVGEHFILITVDGLHLLLAPSTANAKELSVDTQEDLPAFDAILDLAPDGVSEQIAEQLNISRIRPDDKSSGGNTIALSSEDPKRRDSVGVARSTTVVRVGTTPWEMSGELRELFEKKEAACRESQAVFAKLSVAQLNFKPSNGSHTPRWNAEHMMGRELLFFSQIYAKIEPAISVVDLNPKQMPPDYRAAHPDWTGEEEARQMQRVSAFSRRFAYLMRDLDLNKKPAGSSWTPRGLLLQMQRHYDEHTANVIKKFELEDWPKE